MEKKLFFLFVSLILCASQGYAQEEPKSMQQRTEAAVRTAEQYYKGNHYQEAFDKLRQMDQVIATSKESAANKAALHYQTTKVRMQMYMKMKRSQSALDQLNRMDAYASQSGSESVANDLLYNKAIYYYSFGQSTQGNAVFEEMAHKLTASKEYDKVDEVYQTLIANGRNSGNASLVAQSYKKYMAWKDSTSAQKVADEIAALKQEIANGKATIADKDNSLASRQLIIVGLGILAGALAVVLVVGALVLLRFIVLSRKQKKLIRLANDSNALKAKFISNISVQMAPALKKLDQRQPEVKAMMEFTSHIQTLSELENTASQTVELEETPLQPFCEELTDEIRNRIKPGVNLTVEVPKTSAKIHREYVSHILRHLLGNAADYVTDGGTIVLAFKKRGPHTHQFIVSDTGEGIPEERREDVFKPFREIHDLTKGDGLGLPICKQMALKMNGDLDIDPQFTKGTRFVLELHV